MSNEKNASIYAKVDENLKRKAKSQASLAGVDFQIFIEIAISHFLNHIDKEEISLNSDLFDN